MQKLTPEDHQRLQAELTPGEQILWSGKPNPKVIFHKDDWFAIPFSFVWVSGTLYPHGGILREFLQPATDLFGIAFASIFLVVGQYMLWGRFLYAAWRKSKVLYAVTRERVFVLSGPPFPHTIQSAIGDIPIIHQKIRTDRIGSLQFGDPPLFRRRDSMNGLFLSSSIPVFVDIDDAPIVCSLVSNLPLTNGTTP